MGGGAKLGDAKASIPQIAHMSHIQSLRQPCRRSLQSDDLRAARAAPADPEASDSPFHNGKSLGNRRSSWKTVETIFCASPIVSSYF